MAAAICPAIPAGSITPGARGRIAHGDLPLPPTTYLRQVYLDTVVFSYHQLAYLIDVFGPDRIVMGTDYPFDMAEYNPVGHIAGVQRDGRSHARPDRGRQCRAYSRA